MMAGRDLWLPFALAHRPDAGRERRIRTEPERFTAVLGGLPRARIVVEASTDSKWVARCLEALGHEVIIADPNFAPMYATRTRKVRRLVVGGLARFRLREVLRRAQALRMGKRGG